VNGRQRKFIPTSLLIIILLLFCNTYLRISNPPKNNLGWDTFGYYLYLPATFIYHDLGLENKQVIDGIIKKYKPSNTFYQAHKGPKKYWIMKYSMGMAVFFSPAFFIGHIIALNSDFPADGFSKPYQWAMVFNGILIFFIGLLYLRKVLLEFFSENILTLVILLLYFGTNYFSYSTFNAEMPHTYLFSMYAILLYYTIRWHQTFKTRYIVSVAIIISLSTLARPTEIISVFIPLLWNVSSYSTFKQKIKKIWHYQKKQVLVFVLIALFIGSFQVIYWKIYSGSFIYYSYRNPGEGFEFLWPYTLKFLFSFRKGWLIYTPMMFFAIWGMIILYRKNRPIFYSVFMFFIVNLYIVSSWSCWWYAQSMGSRAVVQSYAVLSIPFGYSLKAISKTSLIKKSLLIMIIVFFTALNLFQTWQLSKGILSSDRMTFAYYLKSFGKVKIKSEDKKLLLINRSHNGIDVLTNSEQYKKTILKKFDFESPEDQFNQHYCDTIHFSGSGSLKMDNTLKFSPSFSIPYKEITDNYYAWIRAEVWVYPVHKIYKTPVSLVVTFQHDGKNYKYRAVNLNTEDAKKQLTLYQWNKVTFDYLTPEVRSKNDNLAVYIWNRGKEDIYFDDLIITSFEEKE